MEFIKLFLHPHFVVKYYLLRDIRAVLHRTIFIGTLIDIGCGTKPYQDEFTGITRYDGIDFPRYSQNATFKSNTPDFYFDKQYEKTLELPFEDASYQNAVSFQVLEHHKDPKKMISEMCRVVKKGGYLLVSAPFFGSLHEEPHDYFRFTVYGLVELFRQNKCQVMEVRAQGSIFSTIVTLLFDYVMEFSHINIVCKIVAMILAPFLLILSYLTMVLDFLFPSKKIMLNYVVLARKL